MLTTGIDEIGRVTGYGLALYFRFLKNLGLTFLLLTILALPAILINVSGERITEENRDPLSVSVTSLGNNGMSEQQQSVHMRNCVSAPGTNCNVTMIGTLS